MTRPHALPRLFGALLVAGGTLAGPPLVLAQQGWTGTTQPLPLAGTAGNSPQLTIDPLGNMTMAWNRTDLATGAIEAVRYRAGVGWIIPPVVISTPGQDAFNPRLGSDGAGNVIAIWIRFDAGTFSVQSTRWAVATGQWSGVSDIAVVGPGGAGPELAVTSAGDGVAVWTQQIGTSLQVQAVRFTAATGTWGVPVTASAPGSLAYLADVAMAPNGTALAVWTRADGADEYVEAATGDGTTGAWGPATRLSASAPFAGDVSVAVDGSGRGLAVWMRQGDVQSARFDPAGGGTWSAPATLSSGPASDLPALALNAQGDAVAVWRLADSGAIEGSRYLAATHTWSASTIANSANGYGPAVAIDDAGNAIAIWQWVSTTTVMQAARFVHATDAWTAAVPVTTSGYAYQPVVAAEPRGSFTALWLGDAGANTVVRQARWSAAPAPPHITAIDVAGTTATVQVSPPVTTEPAFAAISYEYTLRALTDWIPAPVGSPITLTDLLPNRWIFTIRAINAAGPGEYSSQVFDVLPAPPTGFVTTSVAGRTASFAWVAPPNLPPGCSYDLEGGVLPGQTLAVLSTFSAATSLTAIAPSGVYYLRLRTFCFGLRSAPSNELRVAVDVAEAPSAPAHLLGLVDGATLSLSWTATFEGGVPAALWIQVSGDVTGAAPIPVGETFSMTGVPPGTYTLQLVAVNAAGASAPSNAVTLTFPGACSGPPATPAGLWATASGPTVTAMWQPPTQGAALTHYVLAATGSYAGAVATPLRQVSGNLPPGTYTFTVAAANACGTSPATAGQTVVVP